MPDSIPASMTAIEITQPGKPEVLKPTSRPTPKPTAGEVLIRVVAAGVNRPDVLQRYGKYPPPAGASDLPGLEVAGRIVACGTDAKGFKVGDQVCALLAGGGYAEYAVAPAPQCLPVPKGLTAIEAAAVPETFFTVWTNVFERGRLQHGETFLVHGGASGIGTTAIQLARAHGARVFATAGTAEKCAACERLGAERAINYRDEDFVAVVKEETAGAGADVILDMVGGEYTARNLDLLRIDGRLVQIAFLKGSKVEIDLNPLMRKRLTFTGSTLRARSVAEKGAVAAAVRRNVWPLVESGKVKPVIHATFPLADAAKAHAMMEADQHIGKIVLTTG
ncbi:MAG TPA: NAD(P)H-quinone oxidoreductase [Alphaproteobacteria bacterium]|nr:NAD(P)H-quinone oxidoreductase [Alphaproteobacteria bacterium]